MLKIQVAAALAGARTLVINGTTTQNAFIVTNTVDGGGTGNVTNGGNGTAFGASYKGYTVN